MTAPIFCAIILGRIDLKENDLKMRKNSIGNSMLLLLAAIIWGVAFVAQSAGMDYMGPLTFNASRFLIGGVLLLPFALSGEIKKWKKTEDTLEREKNLKITIIGGICCGLAICIASIFQQYGILYTTVGKAGFITALYIVLVPIFGLFLGKRPRWIVWPGAVLAVIGLYLLCMNGTMSINKGDMLLFCCALVFTVHIMVIDYFSPKANGVTLSCIQFLFSGIVCIVAAFIFEKPSLDGIVSGLMPILYAGVMSCGVAYTLQIIGQKHVEPAVASIILSMESVVSVLAGWVLLNERLAPKEIAGCLLMFVAVILVQLPERKKTDV